MAGDNMLGNRICELRSARGMSRQELAQELMVSQQAVGKWERGEALPDVLRLKQIAELFQTSLDSFFVSANSCSKVETGNISTQNQQDIDKGNAGWDMSFSNWEGADFSRMKKKARKLNCCKIIDSRFNEASLTGMEFKSDSVLKSSFVAADFSHSKITSSCFKICDFSNAILESTSFSSSLMNECLFFNADFSHAKFSFSKMENCDFRGIKLFNTTFRHTVLDNACLENNIEGCTFLNCQLKNVVFKNVHFSNTFFKNVKFSNCLFNDCTADGITMSFLAQSKIHLTGIKLVNLD